MMISVVKDLLVFMTKIPRKDDFVQKSFRVERPPDFADTEPIIRSIGPQ